MKNKAQSSLEFLMIFGIGLAIIMVMSGLFFGYFNSEKATLDSRFLEKIGQDIMEKTEKVYFLGDGNKVTIKTKFPDNIQNISIHRKNISGLEFDILNITYIANQNINFLIFTANEPYIRFNCTRCYQNNTLNPNVSYFNDSSDFSPGSKRITVESYGDWVGIDFDKD
jgi:uncharacterized protein (UPF0333 family)